MDLGYVFRYVQMVLETKAQLEIGNAYQLALLDILLRMILLGDVSHDVIQQHMDITKFAISQKIAQ